MIRLRTLILLTVVLTGLHLTAIVLGFYKGRVWVDIPLHIIGGALLGLFWIWLLERPSLKNFFGAPSRLFIGLSIISFALFGSFLWEIFEWLVLYFSPHVAFAFSIFSPSVSDALSDMFFGMLGGAAVAFLNYKRK